MVLHQLDIAAGIEVLQVLILDGVTNDTVFFNAAEQLEVLF